MDFLSNITSNKLNYQIFFFIFLFLISFVNPIFGFHSETKEQFVIDEHSWWLSISLVVFFILLGLQKKFKISKKIKMNTILEFNISKKISILIVIVTLALYITLTYHEIFEDEYQIVGTDFADTIEGLNEKQILEFVKTPISIFILDIRGILLKISILVFGTIRFIPFVVSILLLVLVYFFTLKITKNTLAGLLSFFLLIQNPLFLKYDTISTYNNTWIFFYILSLFLISKKTWVLSPISFIISVYTKGLSAIFFPISFLFIFQSKKEVKKKLFLIYGSVIFIGIAWYVIYYYYNGEFDFEEFWTGFFTFAKINYDPLFLALLIPVIIIMYVLTKRGVPHASTMMLAILISLISQPILVSFFTQFLIHDYRFMPFTVFFAISIGLLLSKNQKIVLTNSDKILNKVIFIILIIVSTLTLLPIYLPQFAHQVIKIHMG